MRSASYSFKKSERLCKKSDIDLLFKKGTSFYESPLVFYWLKVNFNKNSPVKILITVPKKKIKTVVQRNLLKRRIREAYRKNKLPINNYCTNNNTGLHIGVIYSESNIHNYQKIEEKIIISLQKIMECQQNKI